MELLKSDNYISYHRHISFIQENVLRFSETHFFNEKGVHALYLMAPSLQELVNFLPIGSYEFAILLKNKKISLYIYWIDRNAPVLCTVINVLCSTPCR